MKIFFLKEEKTENKYFEHLLLQKVGECSGIKQKKKKKVEKERAGESKRKGGSGIKWKVEKKKEWMEIYGYMCVVEKKQEKKKRVDAIERKNNIKNKK